MSSRFLPAQAQCPDQVMSDSSPKRTWAARLQVIDPAFGVSRLREYLGPYQRSEFVEKYAEGLRLAGLPE